MDSQSFAEFLERKRAGGRFESAGEFTVNAQKALEKLSKFILQDPELWVLKLVQAAVVAGSPGLEIQVLREHTCLSLKLTENLDLKTLSQEMMNPTSQCSPFRQELYVALRSFLGRCCFRLNHGTESLSWDGDQLHLENSVESKRSDNILLLELDDQLWEIDGVLPFRRLSMHRAKRALDYHSLLQDRARYAPLELIFDGRRVEPSTVSVRPSESNAKVKKRPACIPLLLARVSAVSHEYTKIKAKSSKGVDALKSPEFFLTFRPEIPSIADTHCHLFLTVKDRAESVLSSSNVLSREVLPEDFTIFLTRNGVIAASEIQEGLELGGGFQVVDSASKTDVTGLKLRVGEKTWSQARSQFSQMRPLVKFLERELAAYTPTPYYLRKTGSDVSGHVASGGGLGFLLAHILGAKLALSTGVGLIAMPIAAWRGLRAKRVESPGQIEEVHTAVIRFLEALPKEPKN